MTDINVNRFVSDVKNEQKIWRSQEEEKINNKPDENMCWWNWEDIWETDDKLRITYINQTKHAQRSLTIN